jgi:DnaJ-class molecular chaperone
MNKQVKCAACSATGHRYCWKCGGSGKREFNPWEAPLYKIKDCDRCRGSGRDPDPDPTCNGTGLVDEKPAPVLRRRR